MSLEDHINRFDRAMEHLNELNVELQTVVSAAQRLADSDAALVEFLASAAEAPAVLRDVAALGRDVAEEVRSANHAISEATKLASGKLESTTEAVTRDLSTRTRELGDTALAELSAWLESQQSAWQAEREKRSQILASAERSLRSTTEQLESTAAETSERVVSSTVQLVETITEAARIAREAARSVAERTSEIDSLLRSDVSTFRAEMERISSLSLQLTTAIDRVAPPTPAGPPPPSPAMMEKLLSTSAQVDQLHNLMKIHFVLSVFVVGSLIVLLTLS